MSSQLTQLQDATIAQHCKALRMPTMAAQFNTLAMPLGVYFTTLFGNYGGEADDLALAFLIASSQGRHRAKQWLDDPELCRGEATASMNGLRNRAARYLDAVKNMPAPAGT